MKQNNRPEEQVRRERRPRDERAYDDYDDDDRYYRNRGNGGDGGGSLLRRLFYFFMIIFFVVTTLAIYTLMIGFQSAQESVVAPIGNLVRQLVVEATPVIVPDPAIVIKEVNALARLETASMTLNKVVRVERNSDFMWGAFGETMLFVAYGDVVAGVDLAKIEDSHLQVVDPETVMLYLPRAEVFNEGSILNTEESYVADRDEGWLANADPQLETMVRREAEAALLADGLEANVLGIAQTNAETYMREFLEGLGFTNVIFTDEPPPIAEPYEQEVPKGMVIEGSE
ncbi:MAG TPA: DUF4230 domain-containing protein [Anaerolineae bacterium]|nr:DUF4230 domain-containing protein [Anaerolineae bacterium]